MLMGLDVSLWMTITFSSLTNNVKWRRVRVVNVSD